MLKTKIDLKKKLKVLEVGLLAAQKYRKKKKAQLETIKRKYPVIADELQEVSNEKIGRPRLERSQPALLDTIVKLVSPTGAAEDKRRSEQLRACQTLDELLDLLKQQGFQLSRSALYLRLLPRCSLTLEGKRHVKTVPVKLLRAQNNFRKKHTDFHFTAATMMWLRQIGEILGNGSVCVISQDDKARVPLGLAASAKQSPILMHLDYTVRLPDHDWVVAGRHKLIPSVYAGLLFNPQGKVCYSGPIYIAIRSGKHDSSTARSHATDLQRLIDLPAFSNLTKREDGKLKPILIILSDGGQDENPRYPKTLIEGYKHFIKYDLDAFFVGCYAPGLSAFNPVERRMTPLSRDLSGVILPYDSFGSHLDGNGKTIDLELEKENFSKAGELLASVWNENIIDGFQVTAEFIAPADAESTERTRPSEEWIWKHVQQSQYLLQIVKCKNISCCSPPRTNLFDLLVDRFLPAPLLFRRGDQGLRLRDPKDEEESNCYYGDLCHRLALKALDPISDSLPILPFDLYCPSVSTKIRDRICKVCFHYLASQSALKSHLKVHKSLNPTPPIEEDIEFICEGVMIEDEPFPVIDSLDNWLCSIFVTDLTVDDVQTPI